MLQSGLQPVKITQKSFLKKWPKTEKKNRKCQKKTRIDSKTGKNKKKQEDVKTASEMSLVSISYVAM